MQIHGVREIRTACASVSSARNSIPAKSGFSPAQWVLGRSPLRPGSILADPNNLASLSSAEVVPDFARRLAVIKAAQTAFVEMDGSDRLRRAILRRSRPGVRDVEIGEQIFFWKPSRSGKKTRAVLSSRWVGPAVINGVNHDQQFGCRAVINCSRLLQNSADVRLLRKARLGTQS